MRFMATRQLIWNKNYNVKPCEICSALNRLTDSLQTIFSTKPKYQELVRMIMSFIGHGGEGDAGQRIRDEILVIQVNAGYFTFAVGLFCVRRMIWWMIRLLIRWFRGAQRIIVSSFGIILNLPKYFKHNNFSSFVRQLNTYIRGLNRHWNCHLISRLEGKVAVVTGGASGIGECAARLFAKQGAKIIIADIQDDLGNSLANDLGMNASFLHCDVTNEMDVKDTVDFAMSKYGKLDIMFNNAGIIGALESSILHTDKAHFEEVIQVNLVGPFLGIKHSARAMVPARGGSIITTASTSSILGGTMTHAYTASKHGVLGLTRNAAVELGRHGVRVNCISPYATPTPMSKKALNFVDDAEFDNIFSNIKGSFYQKEDVAQAALYLGSDESRYVSGHNLVVDGGFTIMNAGLNIFDDASSSSS